MSFEHPYLGGLLYEARKRDEQARVERALRLRALDPDEQPRNAIRTTVGAAMMRGGGWIAGARVRVYVDCAGQLAVDC